MNTQTTFQVPMFLLSFSFVASAGETSGFSIHKSAKNGNPEESHVINVQNVDLSAYVPHDSGENSNQTKNPNSAPNSCHIQVTLEPGGAVKVEDKKDRCPALAWAAQAWTYTTEKMLFESVTWDLKVFDFPGGPVLGIPVELLETGAILPAYAVEYQKVKSKKGPQPKFPRGVKKDLIGTHAICTASMIISAEGEVLENTVKVGESCPEAFQKAATKALNKWTFVPYRIGDQTYQSDFIFALKFAVK